MNLYRSNKKSGSTINVQSSKTVTAGTSQQTVTPDTGYDAMGEVVVNPTPFQTKSVTATTSVQTVSPDSGKFLSQVTVNPQIHSQTVYYSSNGTKDLGVNNNVRYVNINVPSGGWSETTLWTNSSPTSNFAAQDITLNQGISNFDFIRIYWRVKASVSTENSIIVSASDFPNFNAGTNINALLIGIRGGSGSLSGRAIRYLSDTSLNIATAYSLNQAGSGTDSSIPTKITGIKL